MADFNAQLLEPLTLLQADVPGKGAQMLEPLTLLQADVPAKAAELIDAASEGPPPPTYQYLMIWSDVDCVPPTARYWYASIEDTTGTQYTGPKCGPTPITGASVVKRIVT
jgi:hypothetical protein